ncbi:PREDICTED: uncharacterized protein LOC105564042 [Vollenhovia emeryi]|uniref:uncharacterized protein LOC105564042 n=1 Tax=Vollenhovia emeryi TaxID=411798 RepID=UPI0005F4C7B5|nr:PREDICTED: uncharacterized protein LOC105564042 [Vollenhovia emeryi]
MSRNEEFQSWIKEAMPKIIESFGPDISEVRYEITEPTSLRMSSMYHACVKFKNRLTDQNEEHYMILKRPAQVEIWRQMTGSDFQFHNEILFYRIYARPNDNLPRCFHVDEKPPTDSVIALENVNKRGYCPCPYKYDVPLEYTLAAMREIGRFHGKGYVMKELQKENLFEIVRQIQDPRFEERVKSINEFKLLCNSQATRAVEYLRSHDHDAIFCDKMEALLSNAFDEVMMKTIKPFEPLSTLCHGDFTLDNTLFKMEDDGQQRAMLIDFALITYSTPVVDLSTYLCLHCSNEMRKDKFSEIMRAYHNSLKEYLLDAGVWNDEKYSYDALLDNYKKGGLFGFVIAAYFLQNLMGYSDKDKQQTMDLDFVEYLKLLKQKGGDKVSKILADMLLQLRDFGCLEHFL